MTGYGSPTVLIVVDSPVVLAAARSFKERHPEVVIAQSAKGSLHGLPAVDVADPEAIEATVRLVILWHCLQIVPRAALGVRRFINVHPGLNPHNRGWYPHVFGILTGTPVGATIHEVDDGIDSGPIVAQREVLVDATDTSESVYRRIIEVEQELLEEAFPHLLSGSYPTVLPKGAGSFHTRADFLANCELDPNEVVTVREFINRLRALSHPPYWNAHCTIEGQKFYVRIELRSDSGNGEKS